MTKTIPEIAAALSNELISLKPRQKNLQALLQKAKEMGFITTPYHKIKELYFKALYFCVLPAAFMLAAFVLLAYDDIRQAPFLLRVLSNTR